MVDAANAAGGAVGARNFVVRAGLIGTDPAPGVPCPPDMAEATASLGDRLVESVGRRVDGILDDLDIG